LIDCKQLHKRLFRRLFENDLAQKDQKTAGCGRNKLPMMATFICAFSFFLFSSSQKASAAVCMQPTNGLGAAVQSVTTMDTIPALVGGPSSSLSQMLAAIVASNTAMVTSVATDILTTDNNSDNFLKQFWFYDMRPSLQDWTAQYNVAMTNNALNIAQFFDAQTQMQLERDKDVRELASHRASRSSEKICTASTNMAGLIRSAQIRDSLAQAGAREALLGTLPNTAGAGLYVGSAGTPTNGGKANAIKLAYEKFESLYCNKTDSDTFVCPADGTRKDQDLLLSEALLEPDTVKYEEPEVQETVDDLLRNIIEPQVYTPSTNLSQTAVRTTVGQQALLEKRAALAKRQALWHLAYWIVGHKASGSQSRQWLEPLRTEAKINATNIAPNPSYYEIMRAMTSDRYRTGRFGIEAIEDPENTARSLVAQQAITAMMLNDQMDLMDRYAVVIGAQLASQIEGRSVAAASALAPSGN
jgi:hypothetical protein